MLFGQVSHRLLPEASLSFQQLNAHWAERHIGGANPIKYDDFIIDSEAALPTSPRTGSRWQAAAKGLLKAELARRQLSYADLATKLGAVGIRDNDRNISNKVARGSFTAVFLIQCLHAIGCKTVHLDGLEDSK